MHQLGVNMGNVKITNRACVLQLLINKGAMSRTDIASTLNLTTATVTAICNEFLSKNLLIPGEESEISSRVGRKRFPIDLNYDRKYILTIDIHTNITTVSITNLKGRLIALDDFATCPENDPTVFFKNTAAVAIRLLWNNHFQNNDILGVGVTIIGPVNHIDGISLNSFNIFKGECNIKKFLEEELPFPVCVESNVSAFLSSELLFNAFENTQNVLMLKWGPGVGSASVIDGRMYKGSNFHSSELGHTMINPKGTICQCGKRGCLETQISISAISDKTKELIAIHPGTLLNDTVKTCGFPSKDNLAHYITLEDIPFQSLLEQSVAALSIVTNNAIQLLVPDKVILFGDFFDSEFMFSSFIKHIQEINAEITDNLFIRSSLSDKRRYIGATAIVVKQLLIADGGNSITAE